MKEWTKTFKGLANENRLNILYTLHKEVELSVKTISGRIDLGIKATSKHLIILSNLGMLQSHGKQGSVWYKLHPKLRAETKHIITKFLDKT